MPLSPTAADRSDTTLVMPAAVGAGAAVMVAFFTRDVLYGLAIGVLVLLGGVAGWLLRRRRQG